MCKYIQVHEEGSKFQKSSFFSYFAFENDRETETLNSTQRSVSFFCPVFIRTFQMAVQ